MIIVIIVLGILIFVGGTALCSDYSGAKETAGYAFQLIGCLISIFATIALVALLVFVINRVGIDKKIAIYQEENAKIEQQIADAVKQYQEYETGIFTEVAPESSIALVTLYPELKSDTLVQSQIEVYVENNEAIKELKSKAINAPVARWWLYFGK